MIANTVPGLEFSRSFHPRAQFVGSLENAASPLDCCSLPLYLAFFTCNSFDTCSGAAASATQEVFSTFCSWFERQRSDNRTIIYVSFGTLFFPRLDTAAAVLKVLSALTSDANSNISVVWSIPQDNYKYLPREAEFHLGGATKESRRLIFQNWVPQASLLAHPHTKLFVSHCGMGGTLEALVSSVPLVCIPVWADQFGVAARVEASGAGLLLKNGRVTEDSLREAVSTVLAEPSFQGHAARLSKLLKFGGGATRAAEHILLFLETGGKGEHLINYYDLAPTGRYYATILGALAGALLIVTLVTRLVFKNLRVLVVFLVRTISPKRKTS